MKRNKMQKRNLSVPAVSTLVTSWKRGEKQQEVFKHLKNSLAKAHTLSYYNMKLPTELVVDANPIGLGAILTQKTETGIDVIACANRRLTDPEAKEKKERHELLC